jgi:NAD(P)-dependent dehydrogenase (short-subunit alcohol dehydrogenase family)
LKKLCRIDMKLRDQTCLVTGASHGLGKCIATRFWEEGASLLLVGRDAAALDELSDCLASPKLGGQKLSLAALDLSQGSTTATLMRQAAEELGAITVLINNAAVLGPIGPLWENNLADWENAIRVNLLAPAALCAAVIPSMASVGHGKIVNLSGGGATGPRPFFSAYASAKAGLVRLTEVLAHETRSMNIDVNCIAPGVMRTRMLDTILSAGKARAGTEECDRAEKCVGRPQETCQQAVELALFLSSSESDGISGRLISAVWDAWESLPNHQEFLATTDIYTLRRIVPRDRGLDWGRN